MWAFLQMFAVVWKKILRSVFHSLLCPFTVYGTVAERSLMSHKLNKVFFIILALKLYLLGVEHKDFQRLG